MDKVNPELADFATIPSHPATTPADVIPELEQPADMPPVQSKKFNVVISFASQIPFKCVALALKGNAVDNTQDALRVLDIVLRQQAANRGFLLVRQSFFHDDTQNFTEVGGGFTGYRGFHSSFCTTQGCLTLNMDVSTRMIPVLDFLFANQNPHNPGEIDWGRAKRMLKILWVKTSHSVMEFKIIGLTDQLCNEQYFTMTVRNGDKPSDEEQTVEIAVYECFQNHCKIQLQKPAYLPCLDVGRPKNPNYIPLELASLLSLRCYTRALSTMQRASLFEKLRQKLQERIRTVTDAVKKYNYDEDPFLAACGVGSSGRYDVDQIKLGEGALLLGQGPLFFQRARGRKLRGRWKIPEDFFTVSAFYFLNRNRRALDRNTRANDECTKALYDTKKAVVSAGRVASSLEEATGKLTATIEDQTKEASSTRSTLEHTGHLLVYAATMIRTATTMFRTLQIDAQAEKDDSTFHVRPRTTHMSKAVTQWRSYLRKNEGSR